MLITERDQAIIDFISKVGAATSGQIARIFCRELKQSRCIANRRLASLYRLKKLKRERPFINQEYIYFCDKGILEHKLTVAEFYANLFNLPGKILKFEVEKPLDNIRPDIICDYLYKNNVYQYFGEVHLSTKPFNQDKYELFFESGKYKQWYSVFPRIIIISDRDIKLKTTKLKYIKIPLSCKGLESLLR
jgi:hypothetical protein